MNNLLITGGAGFIGSHFARHCLKHLSDKRIIVLDKLTYAGNAANLEDLRIQSNFGFIQGDINDAALLQQIFTEYKIDTIVNFAAETHVDNSINASHIFMQTNVMGTHNLLNMAKHYWLDQGSLPQHRFHHISTDEVFGSLQANEPAFTEQNAYKPNSPYAASKAAADHIVRAYQHTYGLQTTISHCSNNYGTHHYPEKLIPLCLLRLLSGKSLPIYGDGLQIRDWLHVEDHCRALITILTHGKIGESYNIGGHDGEMTNLALINDICEFVDHLFVTENHLFAKYPETQFLRNHSAKSKIEHVQDRLGHDRRYAINSDKLRKNLNFEYSVPFKIGLQQTIRWYITHDAWWQPLINGKTKLTMA